MDSLSSFDLHLHFLNSQGEIEFLEDNSSRSLIPQTVPYPLSDGRSVLVFIINNMRRPTLGETDDYIFYQYCLLCGNRLIENEYFTSSLYKIADVIEQLNKKSACCISRLNMVCTNNKILTLIDDQQKEKFDSWYSYQKIDVFKEMFFLAIEQQKIEKRFFNTKEALQEKDV